jgi:nicotinate-nucleotide pyrophosphorylase (carboxylating)
MMDIQEFIRLAIQEDVGTGDHTSLSCIPEDTLSKARLLVKDEGILAGLEVGILVLKTFDSSLQINQILSDGAFVRKGDIAFTVSGSARSILTAERLCLNIMQRMSGIATATSQLVKKLEGTHCKLLDTRKTTPLNRWLEKEAVRIGGGTNHRFGLYDMIMIKDNHADYAGGISAAIQRTKAYLNEQNLQLKIEVETRNLEEVKEVLQNLPVDRIMLDNFTPDRIQEAIQLINGRCETEASGGITFETIRDYALAGVDYISVGALTHSVKSFDLSLKAF